MKLCALIVVQLLFQFGAQAHRLDECLQAVRVSLASHRVGLTIDITPGVEVAGAFHAVADGNLDGHFSAAEKEAYARKVLNELLVHLDGEPLRLDLEEVTFPASRELKKGVGVIRIKTGKEWASALAGRHRLDITNNHLASISVYHVNVVKPKDGTVDILKQSRDALQRNYRLEFRVNRESDSGP
jgi:hypothetical protein